MLKFFVRFLLNPLTTLGARSFLCVCHIVELAGQIVAWEVHVLTIVKILAMIPAMRAEFREWITFVRDWLRRN